MEETEEEALPPLEWSVAQALAAKVSEAITAAAEATPGREASAMSKKMVAKRVPTSWIPKYDVLDGYGFIVWDEALSVLDRIIVYPFTASYRKHLLGAPKEVIGAWQFHSHSLRLSELYIIQDRTIALLKFMNVVAADCGLTVTDCTKSFERAFKKTFERRLRERHRLTHAHERPSIVSRLIDLSGGKWKGDKDETLKQALETFAKLLPPMIAASEAAGRPSPQTAAEVEALYEAGAEREARQMLKLVGDALLGTINDPSVRGGA